MPAKPRARRAAEAAAETPAMVPAEMLPSVGDYNAFISAVELLNVRFSKASISAPRIYVQGTGKSLEAKYATKARYLNFASGFVVNHTLDFTGEYPDNEADPVITIEAEVEVLYRSPTPLTEDLFTVFRDRNLPLNTWPYLREVVQNSLARTGWPIYTLPAFHAGGGATGRPDDIDGGLSE